jgi:hypothetical protein
MSERQPDPHAKLGEWLSARLAPADVTLKNTTQTPWMSATFAGARHHYDFVVCGEYARDAISRFGAALDDDEVALEGHIVADMVMTHEPTMTACVFSIGVDALTVSMV